MDDRPFFTDQSVEQRGLADIRSPDERDGEQLRIIADGFLGLAITSLRKVSNQRVEEITGAFAVQRTHRERLAETEPHELPDRGLMGGIINLVRDHEYRCRKPTKEQRHPFVLGCDTDGRVDDEQDDFGLPHCLFGLLGHLVIERIAIGHPAARVEEGEVIAEPFGIDCLAVASDAGALFDDRLAAPDDAVHHGGFAHVGAADNRNDRQAHAVDSRARRRAAPSVEMTSTGRGRSETLMPSRKTPRLKQTSGRR